ncbi:hypothetical protein BT63DRAFT_460381 [Microthyrium microscopicum]|uniref:Uncharacterized protein n=1 Tax=Microthyrium microscopicum TaxID=703497 RepID=A0A6A6TXM4_9PEZI|nr:hypothetical protein BT63DRAFT_460381 [Microthyrium microscopicum]
MTKSAINVDDRYVTESSNCHSGSAFICSGGQLAARTTLLLTQSLALSPHDPIDEAATIYGRIRRIAILFLSLTPRSRGRQLREFSEYRYHLHPPMIHGDTQFPANVGFVFITATLKHELAALSLQPTNDVRWNSLAIKPEWTTNGRLDKAVAKTALTFTSLPRSGPYLAGCHIKKLNCCALFLQSRQKKAPSRWTA